jgi:cellulose synthase/poly-beta-1,6-N-acetylglucosamine synthase-like glycosyltransferase
LRGRALEALTPLRRRSDDREARALAGRSAPGKGTAGRLDLVIGPLRPLRLSAHKAREGDHLFRVRCTVEPHDRGLAQDGLDPPERPDCVVTDGRTGARTRVLGEDDALSDRKGWRLLLLGGRRAAGLDADRGPRDRRDAVRFHGRSNRPDGVAVFFLFLLAFLFFHSLDRYLDLDFGAGLIGLVFGFFLERSVRGRRRLAVFGGLGGLLRRHRHMAPSAGAYAGRLARMLVRAWVPSISPRKQQRLLEILPGALTWLVLLVPLAVAFAIRLNDPGQLWILGVGAIALDLYWLVRTAYTVDCVRRSLRQLQATQRRDWWKYCQHIEREAASGSQRPSEIVHCALIPTYTERYEVLRATVEALAKQNYPVEQRVCAIITRVSDHGGIENVQRLREEFANQFRAFIHIKDPLLPGIVVGKSAAMAYGGPMLKQACDEMRLDPRKTIVTDLDSDFRLHPQYFAYVTAQFCATEDRLASIWQPVPIFLNNLWRVPTAVRVMATAATQWQMFLHQNPHRLVMFSSYSMSLELLHEVGYWDSDVIPEDSRFFWKCFFRFGERLRVRPAFLPVFGDAPRTRSYTSTHMSQYNQIKRWAWGATDVPYVTTRMLAHPEIPWKLRARRYSTLIFNHLTWASLPLLLFFGGALPAFIDLDYSLSTAATLIGYATAFILTVTLLNTLRLIQVDRRLCPKPESWRWWRRRWADAQLFLYPVVGLALSVIPALEAQTRLMFGAYLEYRVTEKE